MIGMALNTGNANISASLESFTYLDYQYVDFEEENLNNILNAIDTDDLSSEGLRHYKVLQDAVSHNPKLGEFKLVSQSNTTSDGLGLGSGNKLYQGTSNCMNDLIQASAFKSPEGDLYVNYRGTGDGRWIDNGEGFVDESTPMQEAARRYFDHVYENYAIGGNTYIGGHSKGGNEAQYVTMNSEYRENIKQCYSFDGQGFSDKAIYKFKESENYEQQREKIYSINGKDDPVNRLINKIAKEENTYYIDNGKIEIDNIVDCHDMTAMIKDGELNWMDDNNGHGKPSVLSRFAEQLNNEILNLPEEDRQNCAVGVMALVEVISGKGYYIGMNGHSANFFDYVGLINEGLPKIEKSLLKYKEGRELAVQVLSEFFNKLKDEKGWGGVAGAIIGFGLLFGLIQIIKLSAEKIDRIHEIFITAIKNATKLDKIRKDAIDLANRVHNIIVNTVNKITQIIKNLSPGYRYANESPYIVLNTDTMKEYSNRLNYVNTRIRKLDARLNCLYNKVGLLNLLKLMQADILIGYSVRLKACSFYLNESAKDFDKTEREIMQIY